MEKDKQKLKSEVLAAIKQVVDNVLNEQNHTKKSDVVLNESDKVSDLGLESLELLALTDVLDREFHFGYVEVSTLQNLTVGELCQRVVFRQVRIEVKKELLALLHELDEDVDFSNTEEVTFLDWGYDSMDMAGLAYEIEHRFEIDLSDCNLSDYTFGDLIDCIAERV